MHIRKQTKNALTLILGSLIVFLMITLLFVTIAAPSNGNTMQAAPEIAATEAMQIQQQQQPTTVTEIPLEQETIPEVPAAEIPQEQPEENGQTVETPEELAGKTKVNFIPVLATVVMILLALGAGGYILIYVIRIRKEDAGLADQETEVDPFILKSCDPEIEYLIETSGPQTIQEMQEQIADLEKKNKRLELKCQGQEQYIQEIEQVQIAT